MSQSHLQAFRAESKQSDYKKATINIAASQTASSQISGVANKSIRVIGLFMCAGGTATNVTFNSASSAITPLLALGANGSFVLPINDSGWFQTAVGEDLTITTGAGATTGIQIIYVEV